MEDLIMLQLFNKSLPSLFDEFFVNEWPVSYHGGSMNYSTPSVNVTEDNNKYNIEVAAPGLKKKDFKIDLENNVLTISSEKENTKQEQSEKFIRREFNYNSFKRAFSLPKTVNAEKISASHENGVLTITVPKREEAVIKPARTIAIS